MPVITAAGGNKQHCVICIERVISPKDERDEKRVPGISKGERGRTNDGM